MAASDSIPVPRKNTAYRARYPLYLTTGAIATGLTITATVSKDDGAFAAASNAPVEVGASGVYYHDLTNTEMNADGVTVRLTGTGMNPATVTIEPAASTDLPTTATTLASGDIDGFTVEQAWKLALAVLAGKVSGAATATNVFRAADDSKDRITATVDGDGNRSAVTLDAAG
jgi:hypothetical protein